MKFPRASGILLHPTSLPGGTGIGDLGDEAYRWADFLASARQSLWQVLPLGPTGYGDSPYQCLSVFAGNPLLISLERLAEEGLLQPADLETMPPFPKESVDFGAVIKFKMPLLQKAWETFQRKATATEQKQFQDFSVENAWWLDDYSLFMAVKEAHGQIAWNEWTEDIRHRLPEAIKRWSERLNRQIHCHQYQQYQFFRQWSRLKDYCHERGIRLIGDIPIFVAHDSAEVWSNQGMFYLDDSGSSTVVAGVPPDYFSRTGQLWGNPLYRWDVMAEDGYAWWVKRFRTMRVMVDIIRLDHFRGFEQYWEVPAGDTTAIKGHWVPGPGTRLFQSVERALGALPPIIAEDLGMITPEVEVLRDELGFPGMKVLQFAFDSDPRSKHKPYNYPRNCLVCTGTHDNNTVIGWFRGDDIKDTTQSRQEREQEVQLALKYLGTRGEEINWDFIRLALLSVADTAIIPLQDILGLGGEARMNRPGATGGNWRWRLAAGMLTEEVKARLGELAVLSGRAPNQFYR